MRLIRCSGPAWAWTSSVKQASSAVLTQSALDIVILAGQTTCHGITTTHIGDAPIIGVRTVRRVSRQRLPRDQLRGVRSVVVGFVNRFCAGGLGNRDPCCDIRLLRTKHRGISLQAASSPDIYEVGTSYPNPPLVFGLISFCGPSSWRCVKNRPNRPRPHAHRIHY